MGPALFTFLIILCIQTKWNFYNSNFKFGDSKLMKSFKKVKLAIIIAGVQPTVTTDIVEYDIP